jgi:tetratricopeptide (TPR) repeat protein
MAMTPEEVREAMDQATALYNDGQWEEAADRFADLVIEPEAVHGAEDMHWNMAMCYAHLGEMEKAAQHVGASGYSANDFNDQFARSKQAEAAALYEQGEWDAAAEAFTELLLLPGLPASGTDEVHWNIAMCFACLGDWNKAFGHITEYGNDENEFRQTCIDKGLTPPNPT